MDVFISIHRQSVQCKQTRTCVVLNRFYRLEADRGLLFVVGQKRRKIRSRQYSRGQPRTSGLRTVVAWLGLSPGVSLHPSRLFSVTSSILFTFLYVHISWYVRFLRRTRVYVYIYIFMYISA